MCCLSKAQRTVLTHARLYMRRSSSARGALQVRTGLPFSLQVDAVSHCPALLRFLHAAARKAAELVDVLFTVCVRAGPLVVNLTLNYCISTISLASVGHLGTTELAAAALVRHCVICS